MKPALSVVIPTFGRSDSLARLLEALRAQTLREHEVIVVDQNAAGYLVEQLGQAALANIHHLWLPEPNVSAARNRGFAAARGELILFLDDDLVPEPDFLERALSVAEKHPTIGCISSIAFGAAGQDAALRSTRTLATGRTLPGTTLFEVRDARSDALLFRRDYFRRSGGFDELLFAFARTAEDQELCLRMRKRGLSIWADASLLIFHDDGVAGGCELRTSPYWTVRARCMKAWAFRYRAHGGRHGQLTLGDLVQLLRSAALNRGLLTSGPIDVAKQLSLLGAAVVESKRYLAPHLDRYADVSRIDHLRRHEGGSSGARGEALIQDIKRW